ncbi:hypothetical protein DRE_06482 [Drechslerella stenobrocha 248]|uniref:Uncharacterized protein n=1 Tax=Drechslerella stenobrocha 248 TaxID=1043628 RepID=W7HNH3_9PEZI|nr:hypothetical protein DRE_06482 [Drechslerella stenobrocha 248]
MEDVLDSLEHLSIISESLRKFELSELSTDISPLPDSPTPREIDEGRPTRPPPARLPPRLDADRSLDGGAHMASKSVLKDSLVYYENARKLYLQNKELKEQLLLANQPAGYESNVATAPQEGRQRVPKLDSQEDQFLDFIDQILKSINILLRRDNYGYDSNWRSMVRELDLDEGFFFLNILKTHQGGELYRFLMTTGRHLGEYRLMEAYRLSTSEELTRFRERHFGQFQTFPEASNWLKLWRDISRESRQCEIFVNELQEYRDNLIERRTNRHFARDDDERLEPPYKLYTPYIDDILKAAVDSDLPKDFFLGEIAARAERVTYMTDVISFFLHRGEMDNLWYRISDDIQSLRIIFRGCSNMDGFIRMKNSIETVRNLFFTVDWNTTLRDGSVGFTLKPDYAAKALRLSKIFSIKDEATRLSEFREMLHFEAESSGNNNTELQGGDNNNNTEDDSATVIARSGEA